MHATDSAGGNATLQIGLRASAPITLVDRSLQGATLTTFGVGGPMRLLVFTCAEGASCADMSPIAGAVVVKAGADTCQTTLLSDAHGGPCVIDTDGATVAELLGYAQLPTRVRVVGYSA